MFRLTRRSMKRLSIISALMFNVYFTHTLIAENPKLPTVVIVATGGTIAEKIDPKTGAAIPAVTGEELVANIPELNKIANIEVVNFSNIDSSQMTPEIWAKLSKTVDDILKKPYVKGVVITHGTDTMSEGSYFLDLTLTVNKPVVFTGAMRNASSPYSDGPPNLINAITQVCDPNATNWGVTVTLNQYINSARRVSKMQATNPQTFQSEESGYLGYILKGKVLRMNDVLYRHTLSIPSVLPKIDILSDYAGSDGSLIRASVDNGAKGIVVIGVGEGNVNALMFDAIKYALSKNVTVVISTRVHNGAIAGEYGDAGGGSTLEAAGAILSTTLRAAKARLLLMLLLPTNKSFSEIKQYFSEP